MAGSWTRLPSVQNMAGVSRPDMSAIRDRHIRSSIAFGTTRSFTFGPGARDDRGTKSSLPGQTDPIDRPRVAMIGKAVPEIAQGIPITVNVRRLRPIVAREQRQHQIGIVGGRHR